MRRRLLTVIVSACSVTVLFVSSSPPQAMAATDIPDSAQPTTPIPMVGALFSTASTSSHSCTATVIASPGHDLALTAAHCITGTGAGYRFAPGYDQGSAPFGTWPVRHVYVDAGWRESRSPAHDFAFLQFAPQVYRGHRVNIQVATGGASLRRSPASGTAITVTAYNAGTGDDPVTCSTSTYFSGIYPTFDCHGYVGGSSGSAWLQHSPGQVFLRGVIGGLHQGGCTEYTSYSPPFDDAVAALYSAVRHGMRPSRVPAAGSDGC